MGCRSADPDKVPTFDSSAAAAPAPAAADAPARVVFVGTSLTAGLGLDPDSAYPARLQRMADSAGYRVEMVNAGVSGETSAGALARIDWVLRDPAAAIVLETGANDGLRGLPVAAVRANVERIVGRIRDMQPSTRIVLVQMEAPPNMGPRYAAEFRALYPAVAKAEGLVLVPFLLDRVAGVGRLNQADGIHPNDAGERIVAATVWRALEPVLRDASAAR